MALTNHNATLAVPVDALDHVLGASHAGLVVVEYGDFGCPSCAQAYPAVKILLERFAHRFRFVFRHYPIAEVHSHALLAAQAAEAAGAQGRFWEMHDLMFQDPRHLALEDLRRHANGLELDVVRFGVELADEVYLQRIQEHLASGTASGVRGTPAFFVDGIGVDVSFGTQTLASAIAERLT